MPRCSSTAILLSATLLAACSASGNGSNTADSMPAAQPAGGSNGVRTVLNTASAQVAPGDSIPLTLHVVNGTPDPLVLEFTSTQRYNFWIVGEDGESVYTWVMDKLFAQMMGQETIAPGDTLEFRDTVPAPATPGNYRVIGTVSTTSADLSDTVAVTVGG